ncbi:hypothetical protein bpr_II091 (plasmid) [Butyrivibrio proteoclasticus B316]|uniref:DUF4259 domain-containing protein n=1 Tax=Butyrivibrio proteoclasticus (strain ATCC 51982 / DSM 14932 / B316) TaxID=515622 RepID=E0S3P8_BUTPB|nr:DUF4259 domain-containing protein [Butyrivibrio proteoclasticus]ADL36030.1 hypothetical protein bpr_II091 [Butyrivibrio proteoclasticus B316]
MGTWGTGPLSNDKALDLMNVVCTAGDQTLGIITRLMLHSEKEEEAVLGAYIMYVYYTGDTSEVDHYKEFFEKLAKSESKYLEFYKPEAILKLQQLKENSKREWFEDKDKIKYTLLLEKMVKAIRSAENKWKDPLFGK